MSVLSDVERFYRSYPYEKGQIGKSFCGRPIFYFKVRKTAYPVVLLQYAIHAREFVTTYLSLMQIEDFIKNGEVGTAYFIPLLNPDGVKIAQTTNPLYKANARGVDLNVNFDARWGTGDKNVTKRGTENFIGEYPFSESETIALREFTYKVRPDATVSYHSKGEEIYFEFFQEQEKREKDFILAKAVKDTTGYQIKSTVGSAGGYKDWCIEKLKIPALTIEVGDDRLSHPIKKECAKEIFEKNKGVVYAVITSLLEL